MCLDVSMSWKPAMARLFYAHLPYAYRQRPGC